VKKLDKKPDNINTKPSKNEILDGYFLDLENIFVKSYKSPDKISLYWEELDLLWYALQTFKVRGSKLGVKKVRLLNAMTSMYEVLEAFNSKYLNQHITPGAVVA